MFVAHCRGIYFAIPFPQSPFGFRRQNKGTTNLGHFCVRKLVAQKNKNFRAKIS